MMFRDITYGPQEAELRFRLLHFWEARVPVKNTLLGLELLLIDEQGTVIKGFITPGRINKFRPRLRKGAFYSLVNFYGSRSNGDPVAFPENHFRFYSYEEFEANCDAKGDLYVGQWTSMIGKPTIEVSEVATKLVSHPDVVNQVNAEVVTKRETATIERFCIHEARNQLSLLFECTATIDDAVHDAAWYYIDAVAARLRQPEANEDKEAGTHVPVPEALLSTRSLTATKILAFTAPPTEEPLLTADGDGVILEGSEGSATMGAKELGDGTEFGNSKRVKRGD
ncbi:hypothetical protein Bca52824_023209 [Brassica carinata]|uniref:DUF223 domain-containing protein n=1 Tax=Brassica carinata TaxID=52824 RepID=A0A8X8AVD8_BRACI|nr:hypothetical protein Bca52824_023209 [Brassica carinata]